MKAFAVCEGEVTQLNEEEVVPFACQCDWLNECLVLCDDANEALALAIQFDRGRLDGDNVFYPDCYGTVIKAIEKQKE